MRGSSSPGKPLAPRKPLSTREAITPPSQREFTPIGLQGILSLFLANPSINKNLPLKGKNVTALKFWVSLDEPLRVRPKGGMLSEQLYFDKFLVPFLGIGFPLNSASFISTCRQRRVSPCAGGGSASGGYAFPFTESLLCKPRFNGKPLLKGEKLYKEVVKL